VDLSRCSSAANIRCALEHYPDLTEVGMQIYRVGQTPSLSSPADSKGQVRINDLFNEADTNRFQGAHLTFEPGARTAWHTHPLGQTPIVISGRGRVQREGRTVVEIHPGDVVWFEPKEKHCHGASPATAITHIALQEVEDGRAVDWLEHVSDAEYGA
jgi:quercetin dioxygenase-like cupin family protein